VLTGEVEMTQVEDQLRGTNRRRFLAGAAVAGTGLLAACGGGDEAKSADAGGTEGGSPARAGRDTKDQKYYWITANLADPFYKDGIAGMEAFADEFGVQVEVVGPQKNDVAGMTKAFEEVLAKPDVSGIFSYYYADFKSAKPLYEQAAAKGIPVVNGAGDWGPPRLTFCGVSDEDAPSAAVDLIGEALGGQGRVGFIGNTGVNLIREEKFFGQFVKERFPNMEYVGNATHDGSAEDALRQYQAYVGKNKDLAVVFFGDGLGPGITEGLLQSSGDTKLVLRGFGENGLKAIKDGRVIGAVDRSTYDEEFWGFQPLYWAINGNYRGPDTIKVPTITITKENVDAFSRDSHKNTSTKYKVASTS
jgi:ABC-type sugar transport system substrate-binding protein